VYDLPEDTLTELLERSASFQRGNDPRLQHFVGVDPDFVRDRVVPEVT
jgi:CRISPR-associated protein Csc1